MIDARTLDPPSAGFPTCMACPYLETGSPAICFACACGGSQRLAAARCRSCGSLLLADGSCASTVCRYDDREFSHIHAVSGRTEDFWTALCRYKYDEDRRWATVLGRILVGFLDEHREELRRYDLITTGALYVGPRARRLWDHLRLVLDAAQEHGPGWPFAPDLLAKSGPTGQFLGRGPETRRAIAEHSLRSALSVPKPDRVAGRRVLVLDDVYSEGFSMREMARALRTAGAQEVAGLVFARKKGG